MRKLFSLIICIVLATNLQAQIRDTSIVIGAASPGKKPFVLKEHLPSLASFVLLHGGVIIHYAGHQTTDVSVRKSLQSLRAGGIQIVADDYVQYAPLALNLGLGIAGAPAQHGFWDRTIESSIAFVAMSALTRISKLAIPTLRPNGVDTKSFPSGHTATAFMGAELVRMEYGGGWAVASYTMAAGVGFLRIYNDWHWFSDVLAGAGVGIFSAHVGKWLLEPSKKLFGIQTSDWGKGRKKGEVKLSAEVYPRVDPISGTMCGALALRF